MKNDDKTLKISEIQPTDIEQIKALESDCFLGCFHENFDFVISNNSYCYLCAKIGEQIVGYVGLSIQYEQSDLLYICVAPSHRRNKIASKLLKRAIEILKARNVNELLLEVEVSNLPAIKLYESFGFTRITTRKNYYGDKDALIMKKTL